MHNKKENSIMSGPPNDDLEFYLIIGCNNQDHESRRYTFVSGQELNYSKERSYSNSICIKLTDRIFRDADNHYLAVHEKYIANLKEENGQGYLDDNCYLEDLKSFPESRQTIEKYFKEKTTFEKIKIDQEVGEPKTEILKVCERLDLFYHTGSYQNDVLQEDIFKSSKTVPVTLQVPISDAVPVLPETCIRSNDSLNPRLSAEIFGGCDSQDITSYPNNCLIGLFGAIKNYCISENNNRIKKVSEIVTKIGSLLDRYRINNDNVETLEKEVDNFKNYVVMIKDSIESEYRLYPGIFSDGSNRSKVFRILDEYIMNSRAHENSDRNRLNI